ncbi:hypothetical protein B0H13DRAFT_1897601 [Mycena leptocephala]|nr:hypothetical protein B0H13DRAFT_1897601 [Mycena leptocephala]
MSVVILLRKPIARSTTSRFRRHDNIHRSRSPYLAYLVTQTMPPSFPGGLTASWAEETRSRETLTQICVLVADAPCLNKRRRRQGVMEIQPSTQPQGGRLGMPLSSETKIWADMDAGAEEWSTGMCSADLNANLNWRINLNIIPMVLRILGDFLAIQKKMGEQLSNPFPPPTMATPYNTQTPASLKSHLIDEQQKRKREARAAASARYRERPVGRLCAAHRRKNLRGAEYLCERDRAREASARYREGHRKKLALKQRLARKGAYINKYGIHAYIQR